MKIIIKFATNIKLKKMTFDIIDKYGRIWAVRYDNQEDNVLYTLFEQWHDVTWLYDFFEQNESDLNGHYKIPDIATAIKDTIDDCDKLERMFLDIPADVDVEMYFRPLENFRTSEALLSKEKARPKRTKSHSSWLRIYAIKLEHGIFIITGGAIKLTFTMQEREHTKDELRKMEQVRNFLLEENIIDNDSFTEYVNTL